jgi:hypothetical protein
MRKEHRSVSKCRANEPAVSEVIGSILLVSIVVTAVSIVGVVLWSQPPPQKIPAFDTIISEDTGNTMIHLYHGGGDSLSSGDFIILVDGNNATASFTKSGVSGWSSWSTGESLDYSYAGMAQPRTVQIISSNNRATTILADARFTY